MNSKQRSLLLRLSAFAMIFGVILLSTKAYALDTVSSNIISPIISEGFDLAKFAGIVIGVLLGLIATLLWIITRLLSFVFQLTGGIMYGFFINNPLDTEIGYIRPLWSFLVDFGNLIVIGSFIALALVYLFDIDLPVNKDIGKFAAGIVMIALLLNFSLTLTSAFASTVHSIGIGTVYATQTKNGTNLDLSSRNAFNRSVLATGNSFFEAVKNNFVENISCFGSKTTEYKTGAEGKSETKNMGAVCQFHKKDNTEQLNAVSIIAASDGTPEAFTFYMILIIRELLVLVLLAVGISVLIKLLKVSVFRLAYLWIVGIFAGPALVAAFSPFTGMQKYFQTWLKWLVVFSTMMIVFVAGFYLSSYIATINIPSTAISYEPLVSPLESPGLFVTQLVNSMVEIVVPTVMFPIIGLVIMFLLGKYLDETYQEQAEKAMKAGGKLFNEARTSAGNAIRMPGRLAGGAIGATAGGLKNLSNTGAAIGSIKNSTLSKINSGLAVGQRLRGNESGARATDARAVKYAGKNAVNKQIMANRNEAVTNFMSGKDFKAKLAETKLRGELNNRAALEKLGAKTSDFVSNAKKDGVTDNVIKQAQTAAYNLENDKAPGGKSLKERNRELESREAQKANSNFSTEFVNAQRELSTRASDQKDQAEANYRNEFAEMNLRNKAEIKDIVDRRDDLDSLVSPQNVKVADLKQKILSSTDNKDKEKYQNEIDKITTDQYKAKANLDSRTLKLEAQGDKLEAEHKETLKDIDNQIIEINKSVGTNTVVTNVVNKKFLSENQDIQAKIGQEINKVESRGINNSRSIGARQKEASDQYDRIEGQAAAILDQLKAIDRENITSNEKKTRKDNLLATVQGSGSQEVKKIADRKYRESNSNMYGDE